MNYHDRSASDIHAVKVLLSPEGNPTNDEGVFDIAAYHVQQAIEKELKHILHDLHGVDDSTRKFRTHNIADLIDQVEELGFQVSKELVNQAYDLSDWEAATRYSDSFIATRERIEDAVKSYEKLVKQVEKMKKQKVEAEEEASTRNAEHED